MSIVEYKSKTKSEKYTLFPIKPQHQSLWVYYKKHIATFWTVEEVRLVDDLSDWKNKLNDNERFFIKNVLAFFAASDGIVNENLVVNFYTRIEIPVARAFYTVQMMIETIHSEMYSVLIDTYISDKQEKEQLFSAIEEIPAITRKAEWAIKWINDKEKDLAKCLLAFICVEGIFFSGSFCAIYWLKDRGIMPGLATSNQFISRDENIHTEFAIELYKICFKKLNVETITSIFKEAVDIEKEFVSESLPVSLLGMNCKLMSEYIEYTCDRWLVLLEYPKIYNTRNPFTFMAKLALPTKENFFDGDVTEYTRVGLADTEFSMNDDF